MLEKISYLKAVKSAYQEARKIDSKIDYPEVGRSVTIFDANPVGPQGYVGPFQVIVESHECSPRWVNLYRRSILEHRGIWLVLPLAKYSDRDASEYFKVASAGHLYRSGPSEPFVKSSRPFIQTGGDYFYPRVFVYDENGELTLIDLIH